MNAVTKYLLHVLGCVALAAFTCAVLFGWHDFTDALGGARSFAGLVALLFMGGVIIGGILFLQGQNYTDRLRARLTHLIIAFGVVSLLAAIGYSWVDLPNGAGIRVLVAVSACLVVAAASTWIGYLEDE